MNKIKTTIDDVVIFLKKKKQPVLINEISNKFNVPINILENWFIILETNKIVKIDYSGFKEKIIYIEDSKEKIPNDINEIERIDEKESEDVLENILKIKEIFKFKSKKKGLDISTIEKLWEKYLNLNIKNIRSVFIKKAKEKGFDQKTIEGDLWPKFYKKLIKY